MSIRIVNFRVVILLALLLLLATACRSARSEDLQPTATSDASVAVLDVVTATPEAADSSTVADAETDTIPPTSTAVVMVASANTSGAGMANSSTHDANTGDANTGDAETDASALSEASASEEAGANVVAAAPESLRGIMPQRIQIPSIELDTPVVELSWHAAQSDDGRIFSEWDVADQAAGWHKNSSLIGEDGNVVLSGHNNILGAVFRELDQLKRGDEALISTEDGERRYLVDKVMIVPEKYATQEQREANADWIGHFEDDRLTLVSCWPRDDNSHRIIVVAYAEDSAPE